MKKTLFSTLFALTMFFAFHQANATHIAGGQITYSYLGNNGLDYKVTYTFYRDCGGVAAPGSVTINTSSLSGGSNFNTTANLVSGPTQVVPICPSATTTCSGGTTEGREEYVYEVTITLPSKRADWIFSVSLSARNNAITTINPTSVAMYVESALNNTIIPYNNAPVFANNPAAFVYTNQNFCFNNGAMEVDGDSLVYSLITPKTSNTTNVSYISPYTATQPLTSSPPVTLNSSTGDVCMFPTTAGEVTVMAILVKEYRYGQLIGSVERDIEVTVLSGTDNLPFIDGINSTNKYTDTIPAGCNYSFTTKSYDADVSQNLTLFTNAAAAVPFFTSFTTSGGSRPTGTFNFSPGAGDVRNQPYFFTVTVRDNYCNIEGQQVKAFSLWVIDFTADFTSSAPACVGQGVNFYSVQPLKNYTYLWDFGVGSVATAAQTTSANPMGVTYTSSGAKTVTLTITGPGGCVVTKSNIITINPSPIATFNSTAPQCTGNPVSFTNTGTTGTGVTYFWDFGAGATPPTSVSQNESNILYSTSGTKTITLVVTNQFGCTTSATQTISINATPVSNFSSTAPQCTGLPVNFTNSGTTTGVTYAWNLGSGATPATSTSQNPTGVVYSTAGTKTIKLYTSNGSCTDSSIQTIIIHQTPTVSFSSNAPQCAGIGVNFSNTGSTGTNWSYGWSFGQNALPANSTSQNPTGIIYSTGGTKQITLTISDQFCTKTDTQSILVNATPIANFTSTAPQCTGLPVNFTNTGTTTGVTYAWDFGSGASPATSTVQNPTGIIYSTAGTKMVKLYTSNGTCIDSSKHTITINQTPAASFTSTAPKCANSPVSFTNTGSTGSNWSYSWNFGTGALPANSSAENPNGIVYAAGGTKLITLTITDGICTNTDTSSININNLPVANAGKDTTICANASVQIGSASIAGNTYNWFPVNTLSNATISNPVASPIAPTTEYIVTVTNTLTGCSTNDTAIVTMLAPLIANAGVDGAICRNDSIQVGTGLVKGQVYSWSPASGLNSTTAPNPVSSPSVTTTYTLTVTGSGCPSVQDEVTITVHQLPNVNAGPDDTITVGSSVQLTATGAIQYLWVPASGLNNAGIYNPIAGPDTSTIYIVKGTDIFGCVNYDTIKVFVIKPSFWAPSAFTPDGNGHNDVFYIRGEGIKNFELRIFNRWSEEIFFSKDITQGWDGKRQLGGEDMPEGAYLYNVRGVLSDGTSVNMKALVNLIR